MVAPSFRKHRISHRPQQQPAVQRLIDVLVADAHDGRRVEQQPPMIRPPSAGCTILVRTGRRRKRRRDRQQALAEHQRDDAADHAERGIGQQLRRMHQPVGRHMKQRFVAQNRALHDDGGDRRDDRRAEQRRIHVADDFLEREQHGGDRRVERSGERSGGADRHQDRGRAAGERPSQRPITDARPAPICTDGPSRPIEWPDPMHSTPVMNLPNGTRPGMTPPRDGRRPRSVARRCRGRPGTP